MSVVPGLHLHVCSGSRFRYRYAPAMLNGSFQMRSRSQLRSPKSIRFHGCFLMNLPFLRNGLRNRWRGPFRQERLRAYFRSTSAADKPLISSRLSFALCNVAAILRRRLGCLGCMAPISCRIWRMRSVVRPISSASSQFCFDQSTLDHLARKAFCRARLREARAALCRATLSRIAAW